MISEAEKLATYCKVLASKVGNNWQKDSASNRIDESGSGHSEKEMDKLKVVSCCRKLRKAVVTTRLNMKLLEKKLVNKFEQKYGNAADIDVESRPSEASGSNQETTPRCGKRLIVKIKNFREANRKQDFYAEIRNSPIPPSSDPMKTPSSHKSDGSINSLATLPLAKSPLPTRENPDDDELSNRATPTRDEENILPNEEESHLVDDDEQFFDSKSELVDDKPIEARNPLELDDFESTDVPEERESNTNLANMLKFAQDGDTSTLDASAKSLSLRMSPSFDEVLNNKNLSQGSECTTPLPTLSIKDRTKIPSHQKVHQLKKDSETVEKKATKLKLMTSSSNKKGGQNCKQDDSMKEDEANASPASANSSVSKPKPLTSTPELNEKARLELLKSSDSDDSLGEIKLSPRVKRTKKRVRIPSFGLDDPKLRAECAVVVSRITNLVVTRLC